MLLLAPLHRMPPPPRPRSFVKPHIKRERPQVFSLLGCHPLYVLLSWYREHRLSFSEAVCHTLVSLDLKTISALFASVDFYRVVDWALFDDFRRTTVHPCLVHSALNRRDHSLCAVDCLFPLIPKNTPRVHAPCRPSPSRFQVFF